VDKFSHVGFEPGGWTGNQQIPYAKSILDYIFRWMGARFLGREYTVTEVGETPKLRPTEPDPQQKLPFAPVADDAPLCSECGSIMTRKGSSCKCANSGGLVGAVRGAVPIRAAALDCGRDANLSYLMAPIEKGNAVSASGSKTKQTALELW
jgi:hypothetical protein